MKEMLWLECSFLMLAIMMSGCATEADVLKALETKHLEIKEDIRREEFLKQERGRHEEILSRIQKDVKQLQENESQKNPELLLRYKVGELEARLKAQEDIRKSEQTGKLTKTPGATTAPTEQEKGEEGGNAKGGSSSTVNDSIFKKLGYGAGIGLLRTIGRTQVGNAFVDGNNVVRIDKEQNATAGLFFELHLLRSYSEWGEHFGGSTINKEKSRWVYGAFVSITPGESPLIRAVGLGPMVGYRWDDKDERKTVNFGIGGSVFPNARTLGDGLKENQPLPVSDTIRYQERTLVGIVAMISGGF